MGARGFDDHRKPQRSRRIGRTFSRRQGSFGDADAERGERRLAFVLTERVDLGCRGRVRRRQLQLQLGNAQPCVPDGAGQSQGFQSFTLTLQRNDAAVQATLANCGTDGLG